MGRPGLVPALLAAGIGHHALGCHAAFVPSAPGVGSLLGSKRSSFLQGRATSALSMDNLPSSLSEKVSEVKGLVANSPVAKLRPTPPPPPGSMVPSPPPPFDPTDPAALIAITKSFIATDLGVQNSRVPDYSTAPKRKDAAESDASTSTTAASSNMPFYSSALLSSNNFIWVSGNNLADGRTGLLTKEEYLAAGRYFDLRGSFPDLEYGAHDFRVACDEGGEYGSPERIESGNGEGEGSSDGAAATPIEKLGGGEITVRFTTRVTGTFRGAPLRLRSVLLEPNGRVMRCPPTSVSVTYSTRGEDRGRITKLVTDMVLDRSVGNTNGLSGVPAAAYIAGAPSNAFADVLGGSVPPLVALGRLLSRPVKPIDANGSRFGDEGRLAPFPDSVMIQLAKGVLASDFGLNDPNLLAEDFLYVEPLLGPLDKEKYLAVFEEYDVRGAVPDLDYGLQNFRVDPYDPYRVWVDTRAKGTRTGSVGKRALPSEIGSATYEAPPEGISFTFDDDGFCTRLTAAAVLDPLLGNTGGLGGVYGLLYATGTPANALQTRSLNGFLSRATKSLLSRVNFGVGADGWRLSDGRVVNALLPSKASGIAISLPSMPSSTGAPPKALPKASTPPAAPSKPFFAAEAELSPKKQPQRPTIALPKALTESAAEEKVAPPSEPQKPSTVAKTVQIKPKVEEKKVPISTNPADPVTDALNSAFGISKSDAPAKPAAVAPSKESSSNKAQQLRNAAAAARAEAQEAKKKAAARKAKEAEEKRAAIEAAQKKKNEQLAVAAEKAKEAEAKRAAALEAAQKKKDEEIAAAAQRAKDAEEKRAAALEVAQKKKEEQLAAAAQRAKEADAKRAAAMEAVQKKKEAQLAARKAKPATPKKGADVGGTTGGSGGFSFFAVSAPPTPKSTTKKSPSSPSKPSSSPAKRSFTISLFDSLKPQPTKAASKQPSTKPKKVQPPPAVAKGTVVKRSPTISLFGSPAPSKEKAIEKKGSTPKQQPKKSPTINIFGIGGATKKPSSSTNASQKKTASIPSQKKSSAPKRSPTINLLKQQTVSKKAGAKRSSKSAASASKPTATATRSPTFSLFGGGGGGGTKQVQKQPPAKTSPSSTKKSGGNPFGGFFGGTSGGAAKAKGSDTASSPPSKASRKTPAKKKAAVAPKGVPVMKQWKRVNGNAIEGRIYGSSSFKDGVTVTTSSIVGKKGNFAKGTVVQTESGSKYFLD